MVVVISWWVLNYLISVFHIHTACSMQKTLPAAHVWCTHFGT